MPVLFDLLYQEYCQARLAEMRKHLLLIVSKEVTESSCDADRTTARHGGSARARNETDPDELVRNTEQ